MNPLHLNQSDRVLVGPSTEPVLLTEAKAHLRVDSNDENSLITALIVAARQHCEQFTRRAFITQTRRVSFNAFWGNESHGLVIPKPPLVSVQQIRYVDENREWQTLASDRYAVITENDPGMVIPVDPTNASEGTWPNTAPRVAAVQVDYTAGYGAASAVPQPIKQAMLLLIGQYHEFRENVGSGTSFTEIPYAVKALLLPYSLPEAI